MSTPSTPSSLETTNSGIYWRVDAREHLLLGLNDLACAAEAVGRHMLITHCACLDSTSIARLTQSGAGYVICRR